MHNKLIDLSIPLSRFTFIPMDLQKSADSNDLHLDLDVNKFGLSDPMDGCSIKVQPL